MDKRFLLTFSFINNLHFRDTDFIWYDTEEEMHEDILIKQDLEGFRVHDAIEILSLREIEI